MTIQWGDTGRASVGPLKTFTFSMPVARETYLTGGSILTLPTAEPATSQVIFTIQDADLPTITPAPVKNYWAPIVHAAGKIGAANAQINYRILYNGTSINTGNNVNATAAYNWTYSIVQSNWFSGPAKVGDVLEVRLWSNQADVQLDYTALCIYPARLILSPIGTFVKDLTYTFPNPNTPIYTQGRSPTGISNTVAMSMSSSPTLNALSFGPGGIIVPAAMVSDPGSLTGGAFSLGTVYYGDSGLRNNVDFRTHATNHPYYQRNYWFSTISYKEIIL